MNSSLSAKFIEHIKEELKDKTIQSYQDFLDYFDEDDTSYDYYSFLYPDNKDVVEKKQLEEASKKQQQQQAEAQRQYNLAHYSLPKDFTRTMVIKHSYGKSQISPNIAALVKERLEGKVIKTYYDFITNIGNLHTVDDYNVLYASIFYKNPDAKPILKREISRLLNSYEEYKNIEQYKEAAKTDKKIAESLQTLLAATGGKRKLTKKLKRKQKRKVRKSKSYSRKR